MWENQKSQAYYSNTVYLMLIVYSANRGLSHPQRDSDSRAWCDGP